MKSSLAKIIFLGSLILLISTVSIAGTKAGLSWSNFYGSSSEFNGLPLPVGSIIEAYDTALYRCGIDTVTIEGKYGFMTVIGDDGYGGEGPDVGETLTFYINGRLATPSGPDLPEFTGNDYPPIEVNLSATSAVSMTSVTLPGDQTAVPGALVRYYVTVRNTGGATDFYSISAISDHGWIVATQSDLVYADSGIEATVWFEIDIPPTIQFDLDDLVDFSVTSGLDASVKITGSVTTHVMIPTDVQEDDHGLLPGDFELYQNYPNPFNPTTTISFNLSNRASVQLQIYNFLGQQIDNISLQNLSSGRHKVEYNAANLASGVYLYRLKVGEQSQVRKMVLLK